MYETIETVSENGICTVRLNRPERKNALDLQMRTELRNFFLSVREDEQVKIIILTGEGDVFSAGGDLSASQGIRAAAGRKRLQTGHELITAILQLEKPVIAAINGTAAGAGISLALACDLVYAARNARFIQSFVKVGLIPDLGAALLLPILIGRHRALELMYSGKSISAEEAFNMGMVNQVTDEADLIEEVHTAARGLIEGPHTAMGYMKKIVNQSVLSEISKTMELESFAQAVCFESKDFKEGAEAFFEKRKPVFNK